MMDRTGKLIIGGCAAVIVGLIVAMVFLIKDLDKECQKVGGHLVSRSGNSIGFTSGGQMTFTPNFEAHCYSKDGRVLLE